MVSDQDIEERIDLMTNKLVFSAVIAATTYTVISPAEAATQFQAIIENEQEVANPLVPEQGTGGIGFFELNDAMNALSYDITLFGLDIDGFQTPGNANDNANRFHIHAAPAGSNGGIVFGMKDPNHDVDDLVINPATGRITGVWDGLEGNGTTLAAQLANLFANGLYFNVHTTDYPGGEVRGQIRLIPEPATWGISLLGLALLSIANCRPSKNRKTT
jgi:CHRD domain